MKYRPHLNVIFGYYAYLTISTKNYFLAALLCVEVTKSEFVSETYNRLTLDSHFLCFIVLDKTRN
jgi:hypothetical protein